MEVLADKSKDKELGGSIDYPMSMEVVVLTAWQ